MLIKLDNVSFGYSAKTDVLKNLSINVPKGSIYGFIGPNGAGKSTVMQLITGIIPYNKEGISLFEKPLKKQIPNVFSKIGALVESPALYLHLSGIDNLRCVTTLKNIPETKILEVLEIVGLRKNGNQKVKRYSLGMKQRLAIAMTLLGDPELLLLDEPVNGLDPSGINDIRELLVKLNQEKGTTIFISSHLLDEIEKMCTHIGIINKGEIQFEGTIQELSDRESKYKLNITTKNSTAKKELLKDKYNSIEWIKENKFVVNLDSEDEIPLLAKFLVQHDIPIYELSVEDNLEEWFLNLTK